MKNKSIACRVTSLLLAVLMILGSLGVTTFAEETVDGSAGIEEVVDSSVVTEDTADTSDVASDTAGDAASTEDVADDAASDTANDAISTADIAADDFGVAPNAFATEINSSTVWSYLDDGTYAADGWNKEGFDAAGWKNGTGSFGAKRGAIADLGANCVPKTLLNQYLASGDDIPVFYFRTTVSVADASAVTSIVGSIIYDDAAVVYINGVKVAGFSDASFDSIGYGGSNAGDPITADIKVTDTATIASALKTGENVIAVELHQGRASSSDIYFDMPSLTFSTETVAATQNSISISVGATENERNLTWYCSEAGNGTVLLAKQSELVNGEMPENAQSILAIATAATNKTGYYSNKATLSNLESGTTYAYQLVNGNTKSQIYTITTGTDGAFSFAFAGDPQIGAGSTATDIAGWERSLNIIATDSKFSGVDFLLSAGDQVNTASNEEQYDGYLEHSTLYNLPAATVVGNHDSGSVAYSEHFNEPNKSAYGSTKASSDYYFVYNNVLFMVLNSNNTSTAEHEQFMKDAIAATANQGIEWKIVTFHHSIYSVASHATENSILQRREQLVPVFEALDIDVVLMGHDHVYCRTYMMDGLTPMTDASIYDDANYSSITNPTGILYVTANSASGSKFYNIQTNVEFPYSYVMNQERTPNVSRVDVSDNQFTITTYRTNDMSVVDTFTINRASEHAVNIENADHGTVTASASSAIRGTQVTLTAEAEEGYEFAGWVVKSGDVTITDNTFTMPDEDVTIAATFNHVAHTFEWKIDKEAMATETGLKHEECSVCGYRQNENTVIPATGTTPAKDNTSAAGTAAGTPSSTLSSTPQKSQAENAAKTGDTTPMHLLLIALALSCGGAATFGIKLKKKKG